MVSLSRSSGPPAARDLAHGRAGKAVGVPVRREPLHPHEGVAPHVGHDPQRERHDRLQSGEAQDHGQQAERNDGAEGRQRGLAGGGLGRATRQSVDQMAREHRHEQVGDGRPQQAAGHCERSGRLIQPVAKNKRNHHTYRSGFPVDCGGHVIIRPCSRTRRLHPVTPGGKTGRTRTSVKKSGT
jgi:hypothetical protein